MRKPAEVREDGRMRRFLSLVSLGLMVAILASGCAHGPCQKGSQQRIREVIILTNRDYFPAVHELFQRAAKTIRVMMYSARYYTEKPRYTDDLEPVSGTHWSNTNVLLDDLVAAQSRGVDVQVILDGSNWNQNNTRSNEDFGQLLIAQGVAVFMDDPEVTTHTKLILVDDDLTVVGSTNWSHYALDSNNETSVLIDSQEINGAYQRFFSEVLASSTPLALPKGE
jgi:cardiolipin synthase